MSDFPSAADSSLPSATIAANPKIMIALLWAVVVCSLGAPAIKDGVFDAMSTDDAMRLVEVRDLIAGQGWFDLMQHRLDPPGVSMHWSRVIDAPLAALIVMLRPLTGVAGAEAVTLILWPALLFGAVAVVFWQESKRQETLADRLLELTGALAQREMMEQVLDILSGALEKVSK